MGGMGYLLSSRLVSYLTPAIWLLAVGICIACLAFFRNTEYTLR